MSIETSVTQNNKILIAVGNHYWLWNHYSTTLTKLIYKKMCEIHNTLLVWNYQICISSNNGNS